MCSRRRPAPFERMCASCRRSGRICEGPALRRATERADRSTSNRPGCRGAGFDGALVRQGDWPRRTAHDIPIAGHEHGRHLRRPAYRAREMIVRRTVRDRRAAAARVTARFRRRSFERDGWRVELQNSSTELIGPARHVPQWRDSHGWTKHLRTSDIIGSK